MSNMVDISAFFPHCTSPVICQSCASMWVAVWVAATSISSLRCPYCDAQEILTLNEREYQVLLPFATQLGELRKLRVR